MWIFPLAAALISALFSGIVLFQYSARRHPAHLAWAAALFIFAVASACDFLGSIGGWTPFISKVYYLCGATVVVGFLGLGTLYLLAPRRVARVWLAAMLVITAVSAIMLARAGMDRTALAAGAEPGWKAIQKPAILTVLAIAVSSIGTLILVGGAIYSAVFRRLPLANILIAAGTLIVAGGSSLSNLGRYELQSIGQAAGIMVMFAGFLLTMSGVKKAAAARAAAGPAATEA